MHAVPVEATVSQLLPVVCDLHKDKIPNIRLNVAKSLSAAIDVCKAQRCEQEKDGRHQSRQLPPIVRLN
jgi:hypothetical protein